MNEMSASINWLEDLIGQEVELFYLSQGFKDRGVVQRIGDFWVEIQNATGEILVVPSSAVRLIKVISKKHAPESNLLRPVQPDSPNSEDDNRAS